MIRLGWNVKLRPQPLVHDQRINVAFGWMIKGLWQATHRSEAELIPKPYRAFIAERYEIELHGLVPQLSCSLLRVFAHRRGYPASPGG